MIDLTTILFLFVIGGFLGWVMEVVWKLRFKKLVLNPGFLNSPLMPIHGFGFIFLYLISSIPVNLPIKVVLFLISTTLLELVTGLIFVNFFKIRLWDYSTSFLNYKGIICVPYSIIWGVIGVIFYLFIFPILNIFLKAITQFTTSYIIVGLFLGIVIVDIFKNFSIAERIRKGVTEINAKASVNYENFRKNIKIYLEKKKKINFFRKLLFPISNFANTIAAKQFKDIIRKAKTNGKSKKF